MTKQTMIKTKPFSIIKIFLGMYVVVALVAVIAVSAMAYLSSNAALIPLTLPSDKTSFTATQMIAVSSTLNITKPIYRFSVNANITLNSDDALARLILVDKSNKEYLVYEGYSAKDGQSNIAISDSNCEETCSLSAIAPAYLKVQVKNASIKINNVNYLDLASAAKSFIVPSASSIVDTKINSINSRHLSWVAGHTSVSDLSYADKKKLFSNPDGTPAINLPDLQGFEYYKSGIFKINSSALATKSDPRFFGLDITAPEYFNWQSFLGADNPNSPYYSGFIDGWLTSVKNQYSPKVCHSCWDFAGVGAIEAGINVYYNEHLNVNLSEQYVLNQPDDSSCDGGNTKRPFEYARSNGIPFESECPYAGVSSFSCSASYPDSKLYKINFKDPSYFSSDPNVVLKAVIMTGPKALVLPSWGHVVVMVGYDYNKLDPNHINIIFKNSWDTSWGNAGYGIISQDIITDYYPEVYFDEVSAYLPVDFKPYLVSDPQRHPKCYDKDNDGYCYWGISDDTTNCSTTCKKDSSKKLIKDCDDSNATLGSQISVTDFRCMAVVPPVPANTCIESDGGKDYYAWGWAKDSYDNTVFYDYCTLNGLQVASCADPAKNCGIVEKYCINNRRSGAYLFGSAFNLACPKGCVNSACTK